MAVGSAGRIPVGALTDRFGGRVMFSLVSSATIVPVLFLGLAGHRSLAALLVGGFFLGIGGTAFAVGVPFVNAWFPPQRRGLAIGVFGAGMGAAGRGELGEAARCEAASCRGAGNPPQKVHAKEPKMPSSKPLPHPGDLPVQRGPPRRETYTPIISRSSASCSCERFDWTSRGR